MAKSSRLNPKPVRAPQTQQTNPKSETGSAPAELVALQNALDSATAECTRVTSELESRQEAHEQAIKAKEDAIVATEDVIKRLERELSEAKAAGSKPGDDTYDHLIGEREKVEAECKRLQSEVAGLKASLDTIRQNYDVVCKELVQAQKKTQDAEHEWSVIDEKHRECEINNSQLKKQLDECSTEHAGCEARIRELEAAKQAAELALASAGTGAEASEFEKEIDKMKWETAHLGKLREELERKLAEETSAAIELQQKLDELKARFHGKEPVDRGQFITLQSIWRGLNSLDPEKLGVDSQIANRISNMVAALETDLAQAQAELAVAGTGSADHTACQAEIARLTERCAELKRMHDHQVSLKDSALGTLDETREELQGAFDRALRAEDRANQMESELTKTKKELEEVIDSRDLLIAVGQPTSKPTAGQAFKMPLVLLALVGALVAGIVGTHVIMTRVANNTLSNAGASASASASSSGAGATLVPTLGSAVPEATADVEAPAPPAEETCYPVDANVVALFFGQELRDGKIFGKLPQLDPGQKRFKCEQEPVYDSATKQTDVSGCEACVPGGPGTYPAADYLKKISAQIDPTCYTEPTDYRFHKWPRESIRFNCETVAPFDPVRNCRDVRGCEVIVPDPNTVKCSTCSQ